MPSCSTTSSQNSNGNVQPRPWLPVFTMLINICLTSQNKDVFPDDSSRLLKRLLFFACLSLGFQFVWKLLLKNPPFLLRHCILNLILLFAIPLGAIILPSRLSDICRSTIQSWNTSQKCVLILQLVFVVSAHCSPAARHAEYPKASVRPVEFIKSTPKKETGKPKPFDSPSKRTPTPRPIFAPRRTLVGLESDSRLLVTTSIRNTDTLEEKEKTIETPAGPSADLDSLPPRMTFPLGGSSIGGSVIGGSSIGGSIIGISQIANPTTNLSSKQRDPLPIGIYDGIHEIEGLDREFQPPHEVPDERESDEDFWKKHQLWGEVKEVGDETHKKKVFIDIYKTTEQPFKSGVTLNAWLESSCNFGENKSYLKDQHAFQRLPENQNKTKLLSKFESFSKDSSKFYWLLLRFVYASSKLEDPRISWWYTKTADQNSSEPPDNFCAVMQNIQKFPDVFRSYYHFYDLFRYYCEGLNVLAQDKENTASAIQRIDWVRSRPLLGVRANFTQLLKILRDPSKCSTPSKTLEMGSAALMIRGKCDDWTKAMVCIAMVPGGCVMKYPDAALESDEVEAAAIPNMWACWDGKYVPFPEEEHEDHQIPLCMHRDHLKLSFWMHNARCSRTNQGKDSYLRKKDHDSAIDLPKKLDFINEVDSFLADSFFRGSLTQTVDPAFMATVLFDRIGDKLIEDQSAHIFSDLIFNLLIRDPGQGYVMGLLVAGLCIWRCDFKRNTPDRRPIKDEKDPFYDAFSVDFVKDRRRQSVYGHQNKFWDSCDDGKWLCCEGDTNAGAILGHNSMNTSGWYSGMIPQYQAISVEKEGDTQNFFNWYPDPGRLNVKLHREMEPHVFNGNLNWNSRTIVMDLLLLFEEHEYENEEGKKMKRRRLNKLFPFTCVVDRKQDEKYEALRARHLGLWIFFVYFWNPALNYFRSVFSSSNKSDEEAAAVGEVCHVLGITCRTQWMQIGFLHEGSVSEQHEEYLPCRCDRLLDLFIRHLQAEKRLEGCLQGFVRDMKDVYDSLRTRYLKEEVEIDTTNFGEQIDELPLQCKDLRKAYLMNTKHFRLDDCLFADHGQDGSMGWCEDPRTKNVYMFALLDVSMAFNFLHSEIQKSSSEIQKSRIFVDSRKLLARYSSFKHILKQDEHKFQGAKGINCGTDYRYLELWFRPIDQTPFFVDEKKNAQVVATWKKSLKESKECYKYEFIFHQVEEITDEQLKVEDLQKLVGCAFHPSGFFKKKHS